jgi:hypothetical protein
MITAIARGKTAEFRSFRENSATAPFHGLNLEFVFIGWCVKENPRFTCKANC